MKTHLLIATILMLTLNIACSHQETGSNENEVEIDESTEKVELTRAQIDSLNDLEEARLMELYGAIGLEDTTINYLYQLQEKLDTTRFLAITGQVDDIVKHGDAYIIKVMNDYISPSNTYSEGVYCAITVDSLMLKERQNDFPKVSVFEQGCFIIKPSGIQSSKMMRFQDEVDYVHVYDNCEDADVDVSIHKEEYSSLFLRGELVDFTTYIRYKPNSIFNGNEYLLKTDY
ncbi:MAG: hypothetical protein K9G46_03265 [Flavobacteriales bacterium]|nr:hypothetical protein [Flavobacteriales bacterium]